ncbi:MAG: nitrophenyl compound nitroreductase subunit ArsF family protein [Methanoregula sp.]|nr:nitrophenyl compound nitroreductase subunit ArsF family protein [Methanoregula sp.]
MDHLRSFLSAGLFILLLCVSGCTSGIAPPTVHQAPAVNTTPIEKVEVIHFHGNRQCTSCIAVGDLAEKTVNTSFRYELASGRLVFMHVNYDLPENAALATKYGVTGSSLWIGVYNASGFHKEQDTRVWSLINDEGLYSNYLSMIINKRLNGDFS